MNCPTCPDQALVMADRSGIEVDYCPTCRGIWLDRGELDKLIERIVTSATAPVAAPRTAPTSPPPSTSGRPPSRNDDLRRDDDHNGKPSKKKKVKNLFEEIFDF